MGALEAFGRSNVTQTLGIALRELRAGRMEELNAKKFEADQANQKQQMGMNVEAHDATMKTATQQQNINQLKIEELQADRKPLSVKTLKEQFGYGSEFIYRNMKQQGLIDGDFVTRGNLKEFSQKFFYNTENIKALRDNQLAEAQAKLNKIDGYATIEDADAKKALLAELGLAKEKDLSALRQRVQTDVNGFVGAGNDLKDATALFDKQPAAMRQHLTDKGLDPYRVGGGGYVQYAQNVGKAIAEKEVVDKQLALAEEARKADIDLKRKIAEENRATDRTLMAEGRKDNPTPDDALKRMSSIEEKIAKVKTGELTEMQTILLQMLPPEERKNFKAGKTLSEEDKAKVIGALEKERSYLGKFVPEGFKLEGKPLDDATAAKLFIEAGRDKVKARKLATERGYSF